MNYIQQAFKGKNETWMFLLTVLLVSGLFIFNVVFFVFFRADIDIVEEQKKLLELVPSKNFWLAVNLTPFVFLLGLLFILVKFIHQRSLLSLTTARSKIDWNRVIFSFLLIVIITLITFTISYYTEPNLIKLQFDPLKFTILLVISLLLFPLQIGLEEYLFRGYLMQHIGFYVKNKWFPLILTSVLFGVMHGANPEVAALGPITMVFYIGTGLLLGIMTLMDDGLELALGFHFGNNLLAATLITSSWSALQTDAIFIYTSKEATNSISEIILPVLILYPIILLIMSKKYGWKNWKDKLFGSILVPEIETINNSPGNHDENPTNL
jgi:membrane protease YdiL (CAAX protease family)